MKKITRITTQKKRKDRYNIFLNDGAGEEYGFSVDTSILIEYQLRKGLELENATVNELIQKDTMHKSYTLAIHYLSYRMRTKKEIHDYLVQKEVEPDHIPVIINKLTNEKLIDDRQFAEMFIRTRINTSSKGPMVIRRELSDKGVAMSIIDESLHQYSDQAQFEKVQKLVDKKFQQKKKDSFRKQIQNLQASLQQKGFTQDVVQAVLREVNANQNQDEEWEAIIYQGEKLLRKHETKRTGYELKNKVKEGLFRKGFAMDLITRFIEEFIDGQE
ncbi:recombination regulator RecX [Virgibacillus salexigens]|uniref:Regulatory protein RecX n=1 Tax=Virgibacillus massiliensis TaxID=1462526 RepID=A0A024QIM2_9BACI|nr:MULTISPECIES: recombination regulator RecX [Virgibacillus]MYL43005.1 recombination regulator RecX [Virgibacillus massiliensis]CDQ42087.1 Regulatory protein RecX [Virgibacillus massiliensis]